MNDARESGNPDPLNLPPHTAADGWRLHQSQPAPDGYDCRTRAERTDADLADLRQLVARQAEALAYLTNRVTALEATDAAHRTALEHQADALQVLVLRGTP